MPTDIRNCPDSQGLVGCNHSATLILNRALSGPRICPAHGLRLWIQSEEAAGTGNIYPKRQNGNYLYHDLGR